jgi:5-formyltetrahydrofolate cyclo-ligase
MTKNEFRIQCIQRIKTVSKNNKFYRDKRVNKNIMKLLGEAVGQKILVYWPFGFEVDIRKTILKLRMKNSVYCPFMEGESFKMVPLRLPLERKAFGIYEPRNSNLILKNITIAIVPVVGVDSTGARIGFGKGMYDRFFPTLKTKPFTIFVQSHPCVSPLSLCDDYDIVGDVLITPDGVRSL